MRMNLNSDESAGADVILGPQPLTLAAQLHGKRIGTTQDKHWLTKNPVNYG